jgi:subtilisin family serine protease
MPNGRTLMIAIAALLPAPALAQADVVSTTTPTIASPKQSTSPITLPTGSLTLVADQYVVMLKETVAVPVVKVQKRNADRVQQAIDNQPARDANLQKLRALYEKYAIAPTAIQHQYTDVLVGFAAKLTSTQRTALKADPNVEGVYQDAVAQLQIINPVTDANANSARYFVPCGVFTAGGPVDGSGKNTWIWVLDTGIDLTHPDLNVQRTDPYPISVIDGSPNDGNGHGTHVAGIAAAKWNTIGPTGVSAGAVVVPVKVFGDDGSGEASDVIAGLDHIAQYNLLDDVVTMSLTVPWGSSCATDDASIARALRTAVINLGFSGTWVVCAAGNDPDCTGATLNLPACVNSFRVLTVGAFDCGGVCPQSYGSWGTSVDWAATGGSVYSTYRDHGYGLASGTSMAVPIVAGVIHARAGAPISSGTVACCSGSERKANASPLCALKFDVDLELDHFVVRNVRDLDGTEDLFGKIQFLDLKAFDRARRVATDPSPDATQSITDDITFWRRSQTAAKNSGFQNGSVTVNKRVTIATNLSFDELRSIELQVGGNLSDDEGLFNPRIFQCHECEAGSGVRTIRFGELPGTLRSINSLVNNGTYQALKFGSDKFFELNFYESGNQNDGWEQFVWKVWVKPHL